MRNEVEKNRVILGISKGLQKMHSQAMRHGDLKL